jgi:hypothetical protein
MKGKPNFTIVYVFGPEQCEEKYFNDEILSREAGEWVKIGETGYQGDIETITDEILRKEALSRIRQESRTGIPVTSVLYDVFIFPYKSHTDDDIRDILCKEIYEMENSRQINRELEEGKIPAGKEFVYGVRRRNIKFAVQSFDHDLIAKAYDSDDADSQIKVLSKICYCNNVIIKKEENSTDEDTTTLLTRKPRLDLDLVFHDQDVEYNVILTDGCGNEIKDNVTNEPITAKYIGGNMFECRGEEGRSSYFAKKYLNQYGGKNLTTVNGNEYWTYNGQKLTSLRKN